MIFSTIDTIIRRSLLENSISIHWYAEYLFHATSCVRQLTTDTLQVINTINLPISADGSVDLPGDFVDDISLSIPSGGILIPMPKQNYINPLRIHDTTSGAFVAPNENQTTSDVNTVYGFPYSWSYYRNVDDYGGATGRRFGGTGGTKRGYSVIKSQRRIQLTDSFDGGSVVLQYISDGQSIDNATQVDTLAYDTIQRYIDWASSPSKGKDRSLEGMAYYNQKRLLKARLNPLTVTDIKNILRNAYTATIKT